MSSNQAPFIADSSNNVVKLPFELVFISISKAEHIQLKHSANYWEEQHNQTKKKIDRLTKELELSAAKIRDLKQRLYGKKNEKSTRKQIQHSKCTHKKEVSSTQRPRGQQTGSQGHGRTKRSSLPKYEEYHDIPEHRTRCKICSKTYKEHPQTEDSEIIEIQVKSYTRRIKRKKYTKQCNCPDSPGIITAEVAPRLIPKSGIGASIWTEVLINKFLYARATNNLIAEYQHRGLPIAQGTLTGGLKRIAPLLEPLSEQLVIKQLTEDQFHNDETGWKVFEKIVDKVGYSWWLWVTQSKSVVHYSLAPSRSGDIPIDYFSGLDKHLEQVIVICDRYSAYIRLAKVIPQIILAFCWAHVRRDFLDAARSYPSINDWMLDWVEQIGELYHLNKSRCAHWDSAQTIDQQSHDFKQCHQMLLQAIQKMAGQRDEMLEQKDNHNMKTKVLKSLKRHWLGLIVFVTNPQVPMDNNTAERRMRNPVMGRKNYYGSGSQWSARLAAMMFSLLQTMLIWGINPHHWLYSYLNACADHGGKTPGDIRPFIPWMMSEQRKHELSKPLPNSSLDPPGKIICPNSENKRHQQLT